MTGMVLPQSVCGHSGQDGKRPGLRLHGCDCRLPENLDQIVATVSGNRITRGDLINFLRRYPIPQSDRSRSTATPSRRWSIPG